MASQIKITKFVALAQLISTCFQFIPRIIGLYVPTLGNLEFHRILFFLDQSSLLDI
jgi:hypothetical protein